MNRMRNEHIHVSENDLLLAADGELPRREAARVREHLDACWNCRERMRSLEETITEFVRMRNREYAGQIQPVEGPRALLRARLARVAEDRTVWRFRFSGAGVRLATAGALCIIALVVLVMGSRANAEGPRPDSRFTPGDTRPFDLTQACRSGEAEVIVPNISAETRSAVLAEYGVKGAGPGAFEVDYLITPDLGGSDSVKNLWPQPYSAKWSAKMKDRLEQRLHDLVCSGKLDVRTAQRELASNWIRAYKKYVGSEAAR